MPARIGFALACAVAALAGGVSPAAASRTQMSIFEDDSTLVFGDAAGRERALADLADLGVDTVHSIVFWNRVAPSARSTRRPAGFDGRDPRAYSPQQWDRYDALVRGATARGIHVLLSPSSPLPYWASDCRARGRVRATCRPNVTQFKRFVEAVGRRYSGAYPDENDGGAPLPRVSRWSVWNEPNQSGWLSPQRAVRGGRAVPVSPALYRRLLRAAIAGLQATGHGRDQILLGETAPLGRATGPPSERSMSPGDFLRGVFCIDPAGFSLQGAASSTLDCGGHFRRLAVTGVAHHPYTRGGSRPPTARGRGDEITISSATRLKRVIDQAARRGRIRPRMPIWYTEYGFQTSPPDTLFGLPLRVQAAYLNQSDYIAWRDPRVRSVAQYELRDETNPALFQSGLRFADGRLKPGFLAYRLPIWVVARRSGVRVWGQARPARDGTRATVDIQHDPAGGETFRTVATAKTNAKGYLYVLVSGHGRRGSWRLSWTPPGADAAITSRIARAARR